MKSLLLVLGLFLPQDDVQDAVKRLGDDDIAVRDKAAADLEAMGEKALAALDGLATSDNAELRSRADAVARAIRVRRFLDKDENRPLKERWGDATSNNPRARREAIAAWVRGGDASPARVDALLVLIELDPSGPAGDVAVEALNRLCAPRLTAELEDRSIGMAFSDELVALDHLKDVVEDRLVVSEAAKVGLATGRIAPRKSDSSKPILDEIRLACLAGRVAYRLDDDASKVHAETVEEILAVWKPWWAAVKKDPILLMDYGLAKRPEKADVAEWTPRLDDADPRKARVARAVLRNVPEAAIAEIAKGGKAARVFAEVLGLRRKAVLYLQTQDGFASMNLDGSGRTVLASGFKRPWWIHETKAGLLASADGKVWKLGGAKPAEFLDVDGRTWVSPDGAELAMVDDDGVLRRVDVVTKKVTEVAKKVEQVRWSAQGTLAWSTAKDIVAGDVVIADANPQYGTFHWSPDGKRIAYATQLSERNAKLVDWKHAVEIADAVTGARTVVGGPHSWMYEPAWSPDGSKLAYTWWDHAEERHPATIEVWDVAAKKAATVPHGMESKADTQGKVEWSPDGGTLLFRQSSGMSGTVFIELAARKPVLKTAVSWGSRFVPGTEWMIQGQDGEIVLVHLKTEARVALVESATERVALADILWK